MSKWTGKMEGEWHSMQRKSYKNIYSVRRDLDVSAVAKHSTPRRERGHDAWMSGTELLYMC